MAEVVDYQRAALLLSKGAAVRQPMNAPRTMTSSKRYGRSRRVILDRQPLLDAEVDGLEGDRIADIE